LRGRPAASVQLDLRGLSEFERDVLTATRRIPAGQTRPYGWIAVEAGRPRAVRAVGSVLARNPVPLLVPCHRVVRADGGLGAYMFGSAHKEELLRAEQVNLDEVAVLAQRGVHFLGSDTTGVVCFPTCPHARRITLVHRHGFRTIGAAVAAGYRPCRHCRPTTEPVPA
jgi:methylated-DNA-[protein]-cysteine S-methyltransferase